MNAIVNTANTQCLGHTAYIGNCKSREQLRNTSHDKLNEYSNNADIKEATTNAHEKTNKKGLLRKTVTTYDLFITYFHKDNCDACNHYQLVDHEITQEIEEEKTAPIASVVNEILFPKASVKNETESSLVAEDKSLAKPNSLPKSTSLAEEKRESLASLLPSLTPQELPLSAPASLPKTPSLAKEENEPEPPLLASVASQETLPSAPASLPKSAQHFESEDDRLSLAKLSVEDDQDYLTPSAPESNFNIPTFVPSLEDGDDFDEILILDSNLHTENY